MDHNNVLLDGYIVYLTLKKLGVDEIQVEIVDKKTPRYRNQTTTYVYGIHENSKEKKEYVWRVPETKKGLENELLLGDKVLVSTKYGIKPVIVTKIEWLDECPVDFPVKKVIGKVKPNISNINIDKAKEILLAHVCCTDAWIVLK